MGFFDRAWKNRTYRTEAEKYVDSNLTQIGDVAKKMDQKLTGIPFEQEMVEVQQIWWDISNSVADLRNLPFLLEASVKHIAELRANPLEYTRDPKVSQEVEKELRQVIRGMDAIDLCIAHLSALEQTSAKLKSQLKQLKVEEKKLKTLKKHAEEAFKDFFIMRSQGAGSYMDFDERTGKIVREDYGDQTLMEGRGRRIIEERKRRTQQKSSMPFKGVA